MESAPQGFRKAALSVVVGATAVADVPKRCFPETLHRTPKASPVCLRRLICCICIPAETCLRRDNGFTAARFGHRWHRFHRPDSPSVPSVGLLITDGEFAVILAEGDAGTHRISFRGTGNRDLDFPVAVFPTDDARLGAVVFERDGFLQPLHRHAAADHDFEVAF